MMRGWDDERRGVYKEWVNVLGGQKLGENGF